MIKTFCLLILVHELLARQALQPLILNGRMQICSQHDPCPPGNTCLYNLMVPGVKTCFVGTVDTSKRQGRCPPGGGPAQGQRCRTHGDCAFGQRCCGPQAGGMRYCTQAQQISPQPQITPLVVGTLKPTAKGFDADGSVTLVQSGGKNMLFDTGTTDERPSLLDVLEQRAGLSAEDIDYIITSHGHSDHRANVNLFPDAPDVSMNFITRGFRFEGNGMATSTTDSVQNFLGDRNLELMKTIGHTNQDVSLAVRNVQGYGTVVMSGDIIYFGDDYLKEYLESARPFSPFPEKFDASRKRITCMADWVVPGHGPMYQVTPRIKQAFNCTNTFG